MILPTRSGVMQPVSQAGPWDHGQKTRFPGALSAVTWPCGVAARLTNLLSMGSCRSGFRGTASATPGSRRRFQPSYSNRAAAWPRRAPPTSLAPWLTSSVALGVLRVVGEAPVC